MRVSESNCEGESEGQGKGKGEIACASVCVGVCARVRAVRRTQGLTNNFEAMLTEASRADEQGQTLLHIIAWRKGRSPHSDQQCPERSSPRSGVAFLPSLHHETPGLSAASRSRLTRPFSPTRLRPLACSLSFQRASARILSERPAGNKRANSPAQLVGGGGEVCKGRILKV